MAGIQTVPDSSPVTVRNFLENRTYLSRGTPEGGPRSGRILNQDTSLPFHPVQCLGNRCGHPAGSSIPIAGQGCTGVEADTADSQRGGALQLLEQAGSGPHTL